MRVSSPPMALATIARSCLVADVSDPGIGLPVRPTELPVHWDRRCRERQRLCFKSGQPLSYRARPTHKKKQLRG